MSLLQLTDPLVAGNIQANFRSIVASGEISSKTATLYDDPSGDHAKFERTVNDPLRPYLTTRDFQIGSDGQGYTAPWADCRYIYSSANDGTLAPVWRIVNDPSGGNMGDIAFQQNVSIAENLTVAGWVSSDLPIAQMVVANAQQVFNISDSLFNRILCYQVPSSGATVALPATAALNPGTWVQVFVSPTSAGAMAITGAFDSGETVAAGETGRFVVVQGNQGANIATWMRI